MNREVHAPFCERPEVKLLGLLTPGAPLRPPSGVVGVFAAASLTAITKRSPLYAACVSRPMIAP